MTNVPEMLDVAEKQNVFDIGVDTNNSDEELINHKFSTDDFESIVASHNMGLHQSKDLGVMQRDFTVSAGSNYLNNSLSPQLRGAIKDAAEKNEAFSTLVTDGNSLSNEDINVTKVKESISEMAIDDLVAEKAQTQGAEITPSFDPNAHPDASTDFNDHIRDTDYNNGLEI